VDKFLAIVLRYSKIGGKSGEINGEMLRGRKKTERQSKNKRDRKQKDENRKKKR
jgi:hypothetical protein